MNTINLIGYLTKDCELLKTNTNKSYTSFTIAVNRDFKNQNGEYEADFIQCSVFNQTAEFLSKYAKKGCLIGVSGSLRVNVQDTPQGRRTFTNVQVEKAQILKAPQDKIGSAISPPEKNENPINSNEFYGDVGLGIGPDDLPFY